MTPPLPLAAGFFSVEGSIPHSGRSIRGSLLCKRERKCPWVLQGGIHDTEGRLLWASLNSRRPDGQTRHRQLCASWSWRSCLYVLLQVRNLLPGHWSQIVL